MSALRLTTRRTGARLALTFAAALAVAAPLAGCKKDPPASRAAQLAMNQLPTTKKESIVVGSSDFANNGTIPDRLSADAHGGSPQLTWSPVVDGKSYVVIVEDPDAPSPKPHVHWLAWNIPGDAVGLQPNQPNAAQTGTGMRQGKNSAGTIGWSGPHPPAGPAHHYHVQVFALDEPSIAVAPGADRDALVGALKGHVVASGELVGLFQTKTKT
ncbi:MAG TPA: YbhB/YbcL family Raf kinase inhibitor-like protein [Caulobacteraceae bacterium]|jgi:Raf kinase inhibitor-like YbhB/YbcL family protein|nr:YbhB/YbcL family Raf kinase inhibitor-like protein [Caulobacteraceae bacterium]